MTLDDQLHGLSTLILSSWPNVSSGASGFFFQQLEHPDPEKQKTGEGYWRAIEQLWLVTNRHVLVSQDNTLAESLTFHVRKLTRGLEWHSIVLDRDQLYKRVFFHPNSEADVAAIRVIDLLTELLQFTHEQEKWMNWFAVSEDNFPGENKISVEAADDVIVVGYPRGFYDTHNLFPILKSGVIATRWGAHFEGKPCFLIDAKLFPGSSGSIVISKPIGAVIEDGKLFQAKTKQFAFLGVFSGEPFRRNQPIELENMTIIEKESFNVGIVWYYWLVNETINNGKQFNQT